MVAKVPVPVPGHTKNTNALFVGSVDAAEDAEFLDGQNITHILTVAQGLNVQIPPDCDCLQKHKEVNCHDHPMADILKVLPECLDFINEGLQAGGSVLVHCASGVSRSVTVCVAWLMIHHDQSCADALALVASTRPCASPNLGFRRQLDLLEQHECDIAAAQAQWSRQQATVVQDIQQQREAVNVLHAKVDELENTIATKRSQATTAVNWKKETTALVQLQSELDASLPVEGEALVDPPAKMIRKSALSKVERLLQSLEKDNH